jgi:Putative peptidoglycan binding domain
MRKLLTLTCCVGLASLVGAAQHDDQNQQYKKKGGGGNAPQQQVVAPQTGKKFKAGAGGGVQNFQQPNTARNFNAAGKTKFHGPVTGQTQNNINSNAATTKLNKTKFQGNAAGVNAAGGNPVKFQKQHFNLQTQNKQVVINKYKTVNFNQNYKIAGAYKWKGPKYAVFVNYHPLWQSQWWWTSHYNHIVFIYGGWYYWNNYYWYPAWGYAPDSVYYFDGPIYSSSPSEDPAQVVANVQSALQQQGYYQGDIDGVLGPQTRAALAEYQSAQGLEPTGAVDEPTLETLGMA